MKIIFSPHIDDAFLSLGGSILDWKEKGENILVVNVFSVSNYTQYGIGEAEEVTEERKKEEIKVQKKTGVSSVFLDFPEALLRGYEMQKKEPYYPNKLNKKAEKKWFPQIKEVLFSYFKEEEEVYFPLAIGNHVDHLLVREAGRSFLKKKEKKGTVWFYEDIPYAQRYKLPENFIKKMGLNSFKKEIDLSRKVGIVKEYNSQVEEKWIEELREYAKKIYRKGGERLWNFS